MLRARVVELQVGAWPSRFGLLPAVLGNMALHCRGYAESQPVLVPNSLLDWPSLIMQQALSQVPSCLFHP